MPTAVPPVKAFSVRARPLPLVVGSCSCRLRSDREPPTASLTRLQLGRGYSARHIRFFFWSVGSSHECPANGPSTGPADCPHLGRPVADDPPPVQQTWQMEVEIKRLLEESPANPGRHLDQDRVRHYAEVLDQLPPVTVFELEDHTLLLTDGYHRVAAAQHAGRTTVRADVRVEPQRRRSSSPSMSPVPSWACRLTRHERPFGATAAGRATMRARTFDPTALRSITCGSRLSHRS